MTSEVKGPMDPSRVAGLVAFATGAWNVALGLLVFGLIGAFGFLGGWRIIHGGPRKHGSREPG